MCVSIKVKRARARARPHAPCARVGVTYRMNKLSSNNLGAHVGRTSVFLDSGFSRLRRIVAGRVRKVNRYNKAPLRPVYVDFTRITHGAHTQTGNTRRAYLCALGPCVRSRDDYLSRLLADVFESEQFFQKRKKEIVFGHIADGVFVRCATPRVRSRLKPPVVSR